MLILGIKGEGRTFMASCNTQEEIAMFENVEEPIYESSESKLVVLNLSLLPRSMEYGKEEKLGGIDLL